MARSKEFQRGRILVSELENILVIFWQKYVAALVRKNLPKDKLKIN